MIRQSRIGQAVIAVLAAVTLLTGCAFFGGNRVAGLEGFPIPDGELSNVIHVEGERNWSFVVAVPDAAAQERVLADLAGAGFTELGRSTSSDGRLSAAFSKDNRNVSLALEKHGEAFRVIYHVVDLPDGGGDAPVSDTSSAKFLAIGALAVGFISIVVCVVVFVIRRKNAAASAETQ
ncbi:MAG: hypothetical protein LBU38_05995 [Propionibacteriaceae bacterium]|jgi:hypothetical protein|nr:hypothetical protein [Propionibacteriaceae bacterium]